jgi:hypothetical protein
VSKSFPAVGGPAIILANQILLSIGKKAVGDNEHIAYVSRNLLSYGDSQRLLDD